MEFSDKNLLRLTMVLVILTSAIPIVLQFGQDPTEPSIWNHMSIQMVGVLMVAYLCLSLWYLTSENISKLSNLKVILIVVFQLIAIASIGVIPLLALVFELPMVVQGRSSKRWMLWISVILFAVWAYYLPDEAPEFYLLFADQKMTQQIVEFVGIMALIWFVFYAGYSLTKEYKFRQLQEINQKQRLEHEKVKIRYQLSRDLHDSVGHHLTSIILNLELLNKQINDNKEITQRVNAISFAAKQAMSDIRYVVDSLRVQNLVPLQQGIKELTDAIVKPTLTVAIPKDLPALDYLTHITLFRAVQECLTNCLKHADATQMSIEISRHSKNLKLLLKDNGIGANIAHLKPGHGLKILSERIKFCGGQFKYITNKNDGFGVEIIVPIKDVWEHLS